jgi:CelD/BcsL family acetyltransferase involved in cellulose biosynthesis
MDIEVIEQEENFFRLEKEWRVLLKESASDTIFLTWEWITSWWAAYGSNKSLKVLKIIDNDRLYGIAPFYESSAKMFFLNFKTLRLLGDGSDDSDYLDLLSLPGEESNVSCAVMEFIAKSYTGWNIFLLNEMPSHSKNFATINQIANEGSYYRSLQTAECPYINIPETWDDYLQTLKPRMRTKIRSLIRKLEQNYTVVFEVCTKKAELKEKLKSLFVLHQQRWELKNQQGVFLSDEKQVFYREMAGKFLENDWLRFYSLKLNNQYIAHQFCFEYKGTISLLQEGLDPHWLKNGVGNVLRAYVINDCIKRKVRIYDFLAGVTRHKLSWGAVLNTNVRLAIGPITLKNWGYFRLPDFLRRIKSYVMAVFKKDY